MSDNSPGSMVCPSCHRLISANAPECIHCGYKNPGQWKKVQKIRQRYFISMDTGAIISAFCIGIYALAILMDSSELFHPKGILGIFAPTFRALGSIGATGQYFVYGLGRWWTLFTATFLHANLLHIFFNLLWLRQIGRMVEELYGTSRMFIIFVVSANEWKFAR